MIMSGSLVGREVLLNAEANEWFDGVGRESEDWMGVGEVKKEERG